MAFEGSIQLYAELLNHRPPSGAWQVATAGCIGLAQVFARAQVIPPCVTPDLSTTSPDCSADTTEQHPEQRLLRFRTTCASTLHRVIDLQAALLPHAPVQIQLHNHVLCCACRGYMGRQVPQLLPKPKGSCSLCTVARICRFLEDCSQAHSTPFCWPFLAYCVDAAAITQICMCCLTLCLPHCKAGYKASPAYIAGSTDHKRSGTSANQRSVLLLFLCRI